jgi:hypothetical protein
MCPPSEGKQESARDTHSNAFTDREKLDGSEVGLSMERGCDGFRDLEKTGEG